MDCMVMPTRKLDTPTLRLSYDGLRWLAASVLLRAVRDYATLTGLRKMSTFERETSLGRNGPASMPRQKRLHLIAEVTMFLTTDSVFHELAKIDPDTFAAVLGDPKSMRRFIHSGVRTGAP